MSDTPRTDAARVKPDPATRKCSEQLERELQGMNAKQNDWDRETAAVHTKLDDIERNVAALQLTVARRDQQLAELNHIVQQDIDCMDDRGDEIGAKQLRRTLDAILSGDVPIALEQKPTAGRLDALRGISPPAPEPLRVSYSREEMTDKVREWMIETWGHPMEISAESRDRWMERNGMFHAFIYDHFPTR